MAEAVVGGRQRARSRQVSQCPFLKVCSSDQVSQKQRAESRLLGRRPPLAASGLPARCPQTDSRPLDSGRRHIRRPFCGRIVGR